MDFTTFSVERVNMPSIAQNQYYTKQFELEPNVINVFALMPKQFDDAAATAIPLYSVNDDFGDYRWRIGDVDTTSRDVIPYQSLYYDRLMATLSNGYLKIKNLRLSTGKAFEAGDSSDSAIICKKDDESVKTYIIPTPVPRSEGYQTIQLRMLKLEERGDAGTTILHLCKQVQKSIKLKSSGVEVM